MSHLSTITSIGANHPSLWRHLERWWLAQEKAIFIIHWFLTPKPWLLDPSAWNFPAPYTCGEPRDPTLSSPNQHLEPTSYVPDDCIRAWLISRSSPGVGPIAVMRLRDVIHHIQRDLSPYTGILFVESDSREWVNRVGALRLPPLSQFCLQNPMLQLDAL